MSAEFNIIERWPELFTEFDDVDRQVIVDSVANAWRDGRAPTRQDIADLTDYARGDIDEDEFRRRSIVILEGRRRHISMG